MKDVREFINKLVKVEYIEQSNCYGHYPFQLFIEDKDNTFQLNALALGGDIAQCYQKFDTAITNGAKRIYMSLDFPAMLDIKTDFIGIFEYKGDSVELFLIPYTLGGEVLSKITSSEAIDQILKEYNF